MGNEALLRFMASQWRPTKLKSKITSEAFQKKKICTGNMISSKVVRVKLTPIWNSCEARRSIDNWVLPVLISTSKFSLRLLPILPFIEGGDGVPYELRAQRCRLDASASKWR